MKKSHILITVISFSIFFFVLQNNKIYNNNINKEYEKLKIYYSMIYKNIFIQLNSENLHLKDHIIENIEGERFQLSDFFTDSINYLILRIKDDHCQDCVEHAISSIKSSLPYADRTRIVIFVSFREKRIIKTLLQQWDTSLLCFITDFDLEIPVEDISMPYFFIMNNSLMVDKLFIPIKEIHSYTKDYLETIRNIIL